VSSDVLKADNTWTKQEFTRRAFGLDWDAYFSAAGLSGQTSFIIWHPSAVKASADLVAKVSIDEWKNYLRFSAINQHINVLPQAFGERRFAFSSALSGAKEDRPRWKYAVAATNNSLGEELGKLLWWRKTSQQNPKPVLMAWCKIF